MSVRFKISLPLGQVIFLLAIAALGQGAMDEDLVSVRVEMSLIFVERFLLEGLPAHKSTNSTNRNSWTKTLTGRSIARRGGGVFHPLGRD